MSTKTKKKSGTTTTGTTTTAKGTKEFDLGSFRANFDGLKDQASKLPEGKQRNAILQGIEEAYLNVASWVKTMIPTNVQA